VIEGGPVSVDEPTNVVNWNTMGSAGSLPSAKSPAQVAAALAARILRKPVSGPNTRMTRWEI